MKKAYICKECFGMHEDYLEATYCCDQPEEGNMMIDKDTREGLTYKMGKWVRSIF